MDGRLMLGALLGAIFAAGCPRGGPTLAPAGSDGVDASPAPPDAGAAPAEDAAPEPVEATPEPLGAGSRPVPQLGHLGPAWAEPLADGTVLGLDAAGNLRRWDADLAHLLGARRLPLAGITAVAFGGPAARRVAALGTADGRVFAWPVGGDGDPAPPVRLGDPLERAVSAVAVSADGAAVAAASVAGQVVLFEAQGGRRWERLRDHRDRIASLAFSPDGTHLAGACVDGAVSLWTTLRGACIQTLPHDAPALAVAFSPDGGTLAVGTTGRQVQTWTGMPPREAARRHGFVEAIHQVVFDPGGNRLWAVDRDGRVTALALPDLAPEPDPGLAPVPLTLLVPLADGRRLSGGADGRLRLDGEGPPRVTPPPPEVPLALAVPGEGRDAVAGTADGTLVWLSLEDGRERRRERFHGDAVTALVALDDGTILSGGLDGRVARWAPDDAPPATLLDEPRSPVTALARNADGTRLAAGGADGVVRVWEPVDGVWGEPRSWDGPVSAVLALAFTPGSDFLWATGLDRSVWRWSPARGRTTWREPVVLRAAATRAVALDSGTLLAGNADGELLLVSSDKDVTLLRARGRGPVVSLVRGGTEWLAAWADGTVGRLPAAPLASTDWLEAGGPGGDDLLGALWPLPKGGDRVTAGLAVHRLAPDGTARWTTVLGPDGSATLWPDGGHDVSGPGGREWVAHVDGRVVRGGDDPVVQAREGLREGEAPP